MTDQNLPSSAVSAETKTGIDIGSKQMRVQHVGGDDEVYDFSLGNKYVLRIKQPVTRKQMELWSGEVEKFLTSPDKTVMTVNSAVEVVKVEPEKPFLLFAGQIYDPAGGGLDLVGSYASIEDAQSKAHEIKHQLYPKPLECEHVQWWHIVDLRTLKIVKKWSE